MAKEYFYFGHKIPEPRPWEVYNELMREMKMRVSVYARRIHEGKMRTEDAALRMARLQVAIDIVERACQAEEPKML